MLQFPSNIAQNKVQIREFCKQIRSQNFSLEQCSRVSDLISDRILKLDDFIKAKNIMLFYPLKKEIDLLKLLNQKDKNFYFPKCSAKQILVCPSSTADETYFNKNKYGIMEPKSAQLDDLSIIDIVFTPALCADLSLNRLGWGAGFYDRFFSNTNLRAKKIIVLAEKFLCQKLPQDKYDVACDCAVLESGIITPA